MTTTPNIDLPEMAANTFQPSVVYNESMQRIDAILVLIIEDMGLVTPPVTTDADAGRRWIIPASATGAWAGKTGQIALCTAATLWLFIVPGVNWRGFVELNNTAALNKYYRYTGSAWVDDTAAGAISEAPNDGVAYARRSNAWTALTALLTAFTSGAGIVATTVAGALDELKGLIVPPSQSIVAACSDEITALTAGVGKVTFRNPYASAFTITHVKASLTTAQATGSILTIDINEAGTTILSTKLTIDNTEKTSETAATAAVVSDASIAADAEITVDIDQVGDGTAKGLKVYLIGHL